MMMNKLRLHAITFATFFLIISGPSEASQSMKPELHDNDRALFSKIEHIVTVELDQSARNRLAWYCPSMTQISLGIDSYEFRRSRSGLIEQFEESASKNGTTIKELLSERGIASVDQLIEQLTENFKALPEEKQRSYIEEMRLHCASFWGNLP